MPEVASQTFDLVGREVNATLAEARGALETYVEQPDTSRCSSAARATCTRCRGVLRLLEIYWRGAARRGDESTSRCTCSRPTVSARARPKASMR